MTRRALAAPLAFALLLAPAAFAQSQGADSSLHPKAAPGTKGVTQVPDASTGGDPARGANTDNDPNSGRSGPAGSRSTTGTGPLQGGGGPNGQGSSAPGQRSDAAPARLVELAQADVPAPGAERASRSPEQVQARVDRQLRDLSARLRITPAEQPHWDGFASTLQANAQHMAQLWSARPAGPVSALDDMRSYAQIAQAHAEDIQRLLAAFTPLYESLSPTQKVAADQAFRDAARQRGQGMLR